MSTVANEAKQSHYKSKKTQSIWFKWWVGILCVLFAIGAYFIVERLWLGLTTTNLSSITPWGAWIAFYIFFVGLSAGSFLLSTMIFVFGMERYEKVGKMALFTAIVCMIVALTFVLMDLGRPERAFSALVHWNVTSILAWEMRFYVIYITLLTVELYVAMRADFVRLATYNSLKGKIARLLTFKNSTINDYTKKRDHRWMKILGTIGIPLAILGVHGGTGAIFAVVSARSSWNSGIFPIIFVVSAMVSGTALLLAIYIIRSKALKQPIDQGMVIGLAKVMIAFLFIDLLLQFYDYLVALYSLADSHLLSLQTMMRSSYSWSFWGIQVFLGSVVPIFLVYYKKTAKNINALLIAAILVVIGIIGVRFNIVVPSQIVPIMEGMPAGDYYPTYNEWLVSVGIVAMGLLIFTIADRLLPLDQADDVSEMGDQNGR
ncbi:MULTISPECIES: NrfD/PsrC family molybdoenzyme membrane anchor subunit [Virgibacillus]|uniref:NrfD/PsrC family molybdoenzyme membrane anchor subunit n=1 Tax=Virgibacillus dokdonensis TaxID=302167 RepID=A0A2K9J344_9BACI|nr:MULTISPECIES: NrfD/PsrC family molybdoenzyme membrane anchor subunit [Virgibacillus]AUJ26085.1 putative Ni/Fe-hydrogenase 2 b-type cytochrome subunit [Virgibacillus dokdonensis]NWO14554.1 polysulfide reductase NrfD [Virgibacillus sp.]